MTARVEDSPMTAGQSPTEPPCSLPPQLQVGATVTAPALDAVWLYGYCMATGYCMANYTLIQMASLVFFLALFDCKTE